MDSNTLLCEVSQSEAASALAQALTAAGIPYRTTVHGATATTFFVPGRHAGRARAIADDNLLPAGALPAFEEDHDGAGAARPVHAAPPFPWRAVETVMATVLVHTGLAFWAGGTLPSGRLLWQYGAALPAAPLAEPWRLVTATFLHANLAQVCWNGLALGVFAVPLIGWLGTRRVAALYLSAGVAGGLVAAWLAPFGPPIAGSTAAVAGVFGAWLVLALRRSRGESCGWRLRIQSLGVAVLVLPGVLGLAADGRSAARSAPLGGALAGFGAGLALALPRRDPDVS